jgi:UDP-glucuronate 4-epimerase
LLLDEREQRVTGNPKRILLMGGAGFIGSHLAEALLRKHFVLSVVDNLDDFYSPAWQKANLESIRKAGPFDFFDQDICAMDRLRETVARVRPDVIIRLAARAGETPEQGDVPLTWADISNAGRLFGYWPQTSLEDGLKKCVEWHRAADPSLRA